MNSKGFGAPMMIGIVVVILLLVGGAYFFSQRDSTTENEESEVSAELQPETDNGSITGTVTDLIKRGQDVNCTFDRTDETGTVSGVVYIAGERLRGDYQLQHADGTEFSGSTIRDGDFGYFWSDQLEQGTKVPINTDDDSAEPQDDADREVLDEAFAYDCQRWPVDQSMFQLPTDKEFVDLTQQMQQTNQTTEQVQQNQCAACASLEDPAKAQCLQALGC
jgi:hypothetical protein